VNPEHPCYGASNEILGLLLPYDLLSASYGSAPLVRFQSFRLQPTFLKKENDAYEIAIPSVSVSPNKFLNQSVDIYVI
jgi:hypothetical protein